MKLWILRPATYEVERPGERGIWDPWFDKAFGFVVRAETEQQARALATERGGDEILQSGGAPDAWTNPEHSTCHELCADGEAGVLIEDFRSA